MGDAVARRPSESDLAEKAGDHGIGPGYRLLDSIEERYADDDLDDEKRQRILAGMSEWSVDECPACGEPLGRDYRLPDHLEDGCSALDD